MKAFWKQLVLGALLAALAIWLLMPNPPFLNAVPYRDSGVFMYVGQQILHGAMPYRDVWDHKTPLVYFVDALGLWLGGGSMWGVWLVEFASLFGALLLGYLTIQKAFGSLAAWVGTLSWWAYLLPTLEHGNLTEEFALPLKFAALWSLLAPAGKLGGWVLGATGTLAFLLKPNLIGLHVAVALIWLFQRLRQREGRQVARDVGWALLGVASIAVPVLVYLFAGHAWPSFLDQGFYYNSIYGKLPMSEKIAAARFGFTLFGHLAQVGLAAAVLGLVSLFCLRSSAEEIALGWVAILGLGLEILLSSLPGRQFAHYYMAWLPVLGLLSAWLAYRIWSARLNLSGPFRAFPVVLAVAIAFVNVQPHAKALAEIAKQGLAPRQASSDPYREMASYLAQESKPTDHVLVWGAESVINFLADRPAPTRYVYQFPLYTVGYTQEACIREFFADLKAKRPKYIVDTSPADAAIPPIELAKRQEWLNANDERKHSKAFAQIGEVCRYIVANYQECHRVGNWAVYRRID